VELLYVGGIGALGVLSVAFLALVMVLVLSAFNRTKTKSIFG